MKSNLRTHLRENNPESQKHLEDNEQHFSQQCLRVLFLLYRGKKLTTFNAPILGVRSLPRRIKDLRDINGIHVDDKWVYDDTGKKVEKVWFIDLSSKRATKKEVVSEWLKKLKNKKL
jgi:hypothetical protein